jgi:hypothetical protein
MKKSPARSTDNPPSNTPSKHARKLPHQPLTKLILQKKYLFTAYISHNLRPFSPILWKLAEKFRLILRLQTRPNELSDRNESNVMFSNTLMTTKFLKVFLQGFSIELRISAKHHIRLSMLERLFLFRAQTSVSNPTACAALSPPSATSTAAATQPRILPPQSGGQRTGCPCSWRSLLTLQPSLEPPRTPSPLYPRKSQCRSVPGSPPPRHPA